ncbi:hypothetical protein T492DRAFT_848525 [Pavlovales sp. CCMP2436]|nr:hypothetical protein T492DRAFT_848525 [Pavlovales sp. CCMP2436]
MYFELGNPPKIRRLSNSERGFEVAFSRMLRSAKKDHTRFARLGLGVKQNSVGEQVVTYTRKARVTVYGLQIRDLSYIWDIKMIYVAVSRVRRLDQISIINTIVLSKSHGESDEHLAEKARQYALEIVK